MLDAFFGGLGAWGWIILGVLLMGLELVVPGAFMLWLGLAAVATGVLAGIFGFGWQTAMLVYAALAVAAVVLGRRLSRDPHAGERRPEPELNRADRNMVGRVLRLDAPIADGVGRVRVDDSSWRVTGPDLPAGERVRVVRLDGATLVVEAASP